MLKITLIVVLLSSCGHVPKMKKKIEVWNGSSEEQAICRLTPKKVSKKTGAHKFIVKKVVKDKGYECIYADDPRFNQYGALSWDHIGVVQEYIETLINSCAQWR